jgi:toxin ParE1/3/4
MTNRYKVHPDARTDLVDIFVYIGQSGEDQAERFLTSAEETFKQLAEHPRIGRACSFGGELAGCRRWPVRGFNNFLIFYRAFADRVEIVRVLHGARDIETLLED